MTFHTHRNVVGKIVIVLVPLLLGAGWFMASRTQREDQRQHYQPELAAAITLFALVIGSPEGIKKEVLRTVATESYSDRVLSMGTSGWWITLDYEIVDMDVRTYTETTAEVWVRITSRTMTYDTVAQHTRGRPMCDEAAGIYRLMREDTMWKVDFVELTYENRGRIIPDFCDAETD